MSHINSRLREKTTKARKWAIHKKSLAFHENKGRTQNHEKTETKPKHRT